MKIKFNTCALVSIHCEGFSMHFGVYPEPGEVYKDREHGGEEVVEYERWLWGRGTELYDHCLEYYGVGPFALLCWLP